MISRMYMEFSSYVSSISLRKFRQALFLIFCGLVFIPLVCIYNYGGGTFHQLIHKRNVAINPLSNYTENDINTIEKSKKCYKALKIPANLKFFEDIMKADRKPTLDDTLFFHITSCIVDGQVSLNPRQTCAIESAAKWNPNRDIFMIFASQVGYVAEELTPTIRILKQYPNVHFRTVDVYDYAKDTPAEEWVKKDLVFLSPFFYSHLSDVLRFLSVYRFGGIHLDTDFVFQENFDELPPNFVGKQRDDEVACGAFGFESKHFGHEVMDMILRDSMAKYDPKCWACAAPATFSRVLRRICGDKLVRKCQGVRLFEPHNFYPVYYQSWKDLFETKPDVVERIIKLARKSKATHMWNQLSKDYKVDKSQKLKSAYHILAEENCPKTFQASGRFF